MIYGVGQFAQTAAVVAAIALFIFRPDSSEDRSLVTGPPAALPWEDGVLKGVFDTRLEAPDWPIKIAAALLVLVPTGTSHCSEASVEVSPTGDKSVAEAGGKHAF
jgi:hypothetical protein